MTSSEDTATNPLSEQPPAFVDVALSCLSKIYESMMITETNADESQGSDEAWSSDSKSTVRITSRIRDLAETEKSLRDTCCEVLESYIVHEGARYTQSFIE